MSTMTLLDAVQQYSAKQEASDFWFLTGGDIPNDRRYGHRPDAKQRDHFESRLRQVSQLSGAKDIVISQEALSELYDFSAAMAAAIDEMIRLQDGDVSPEQLAEWATEREAQPVATVGNSREGDAHLDS